MDRTISGQGFSSTRHASNRGKSFIHAAIFGLEGRLMTIIPGKGPCLRCLIPEEPPEYGVIPVLGAISGVMGCLEAVEAVKLVTGIGEPAVGRLIVFDGEEMNFHIIPIKKNPRCPVCGRK